MAHKLFTCASSYFLSLFFEHEKLQHHYLMLCVCVCVCTAILLSAIICFHPLIYESSLYQKKKKVNVFSLTSFLSLSIYDSINTYHILKYFKLSFTEIYYIIILNSLLQAYKIIYLTKTNN